MIGSSFADAQKKLQKPAEFLAKLAVLLKEGYTFHEGIILLLPYHTKQYDELLERIEMELKLGYGVSHVLQLIGFQKSILLPVAIAEVDGNLIRALEEVAGRVKRIADKKKQLRKLMMYPAVLFSFLLLLLVAFKQFFLPNFQMLTIMRTEQQTGFASVLPKIVSMIPDTVLLLLIISLLTYFVLRLWMKRLGAEEKLLFYLKIPLAGNMYRDMKTADFASELGSLLLSGLPLQSALDVLVKQTEDPILSVISNKLSAFVIFGEPLHEAVRLTDGLSPQLADFVKHGADTGYLSKELVIYSEHTAELLDEKLNQWIFILQPALFGMLAVCILLAYLSILLPVYQMIDNV